MLTVQSVDRIQRGSLRDEDRGRSCSCLFDSIADFRKHRLSQMCLSGFLRICTADNIGSWAPLIPYSVPYLNVVNTVINGLLGVEAVQLLADARANLAFPVDTPSLLASKALEYNFGIIVYAEVLCCCGIS